ncbi:MAG: hypothetical protein IPP46_20570 [Bacteroidetes bacterium]|nr:hypothetical protein [Bacteroidota bacterium]
MLSKAAASGIELTWNTIPPGNYLVRIRTNPFYDTFCEENFPITIAGAPCLSPWVISSLQQAAMDVVTGVLRLETTTTNCTNFTSVCMYQFNQLNYYTVLPLYQYIDKE